MTGVATEFDVAEVVDVDRGFLVGGRVMVVCVATGVAATFVFWLVHRTLIDDAYITLDYARNLAFHLHWGIVRAKTANTATSPLFVALIGAATALTRNALLGLGLVFVAAWVVLAGWVTRAALTLELPLVSAVLAIALVLVNPFLLSVTGMETTLVVALLAGLVCYAIQGRVIAFGVVAGLGVLARADVIIFVAVVTLATPVMRRAVSRIALVMAAVAGPWFVWSWVHFGSAIPDTFILKTLQHRFGPYSFATGPQLFAALDAPATVVSFAAAFLGSVVLVVWVAARLRNADGRRRFNPVAALGAAGIAYYLAYSVLGVPPYQWYYGPTIAALSIAMALLLPEVLRRTTRVEASPVSLRASLGASLRTAIVVLVVFANAVVAVGHGVPWRGEPVFSGNWATSAAYARIGKQLRVLVGDHAVASPGEIGTLAYFCDCTIVDAFADRGLVVPEVERRAAPANAITKLLFRVNFRYLDRRMLPQVVAYTLVRWPGHTTSPGTWNIDSPLVGPGHIELHALDLDARVVDDFARAVVASLPRGTGPVILGDNTGLFPAGGAYQDAVAVDLRRDGVNVRLDPFSSNPFVSRRVYNGQRNRAAYTVASGDAIDTLLARPGTRVAAYDGSVSWARRSAIETQLRSLDNEHQIGRLSNVGYYLDVIALRAQLGTDLAIISIPVPR